MFAHELNSADGERHWFVSVYLKENPEIVRNLVIAQKGGADPRYVRISQSEIKAPTAGGYTDYFTIETNSTWSAELIIEHGTTAGINNTSTQTISKNTQKSRSVRIYMPAHYRNDRTRVILRAQVEDSENSAEIVIYQEPYYTGSLVLSNTAAISNLADDTHANYKNYVYNLGENMRNASLFGPGATLVDMPDGGFDFKTSSVADAIKEASILQFVTAPGATVFNNAYDKYQETPSTFMIFSSNSYSAMNSLLTLFRGKQTTGYAASPFVSVSNSGVNFREFYQGDNMEHPLIKYLLDGPEGPINPDEIRLQGYGTSATAGIREGNWPSTFVPIIKSVVGQNTYCVFGIDPVHRLIFITDPAIFGANSTATTAYNRNNYVESNEEKTSNINFLNNFIAWMAEVATKGESFLEQFQVEVE